MAILGPSSRPHPNGTAKKRAAAALTDDQAVQVAIGLVRDLHERKLSPQTILEGYAGVGYTGAQPAHLNAQTRKMLVAKFQNWVELLQRETSKAPNFDEDAVLAALQLAKPFNDIEGFREELF